MNPKYARIIEQEFRTAGIETGQLAEGSQITVEFEGDEEDLEEIRVITEEKDFGRTVWIHVIGGEFDADGFLFEDEETGGVIDFLKPDEWDLEI